MQYSDSRTYAGTMLIQIESGRRGLEPRIPSWVLQLELSLRVLRAAVREQSEQKANVVDKYNVTDVLFPLNLTCIAFGAVLFNPKPQRTHMLGAQGFRGNLSFFSFSYDMFFSSFIFFKQNVITVI